jgi:hypothetical protein
MNENKNFSLGGFPPIYEIVSNIKKKEYVPNNILSIQSILSKRMPEEINDVMKSKRFVSSSKKSHRELSLTKGGKNKSSKKRKNKIY